MPINRRRNPRRALHVKALLVRDEPQASLACNLVDISETGARLVFRDTTDVPDCFTIVLTPQGAPSRKCRLIWRGDTDVGVAFERVSQPRLSSAMLQPGSSLEDAISAFALHS
jgi:hypothetical protein